jgi:hypothetical protein
MTNDQLKMTNACVPAAHQNNVAKRLNHLTFVIGHLTLLLSLLCLAQPALAMGSAPAKEQPKYKLEVLKLEVVGQPSTPEVAAPKKAPATKKSR